MPTEPHHLHEEDLLLLRRIARKDLRAYRQLLDKYMDFCLRVAQRVTGNPADAEDIMQDICLKIWDNAEIWRPEAKFSTWLYRVVVNRAIDHKRKVVPLTMAALPEVVDPAIHTERRMIEQEKAAAVEQAVQALPARQRVAITLSYYEGLKNETAAAIMQLDLNAFQQLLYRGRQNLKGLLQPREGGKSHGEGS